MAETYECYSCGRTFPRTTPEEEMESEYEQKFGRKPDPEDLCIVCDECYQRMMSLSFHDRDGIVQEHDYLFIGGSMHGQVRTIYEGNRFVDLNTSESWKHHLVQTGHGPRPIFALERFSEAEIQAKYYELCGRLKV